MKILLVASEIYPHAKSGGLADVIYALSRELKRLGHDARLVLPGYPKLNRVFTPDGASTKRTSIGGAAEYTAISGTLDNIDVPVWLVQSQRIFNQYKEFYPEDNFNRFLRFLVLSHAAAQIGCGLNSQQWKPDIVHTHDWHAGLTFSFMEQLNDLDVARVFSLHNLAFQGIFPISYRELIGHENLETDGMTFSKTMQFSFLEEALLLADKISTVSENYAAEITGSRFGFGMEEIFTRRKRDLFGILNGVDYHIWHPEQDPALPLSGAIFNEQEKSRCKQLVQQEYGLEQKHDAILCTFTNRLTHQKMIDVIIKALPKFQGTNLQFVFHGQGEAQYESQLRQVAGKMTQQVKYIEGFQEKTEHFLLAAADLCLSPSRFEPCGLNALYAMRYGALPIVRPVGGYIDTIDDIFSASNIEYGNGFVVPAESVEALQQTILRAANLKKNKHVWEKLTENAKKQNFSWRTAAQKYISLYVLAQRKRRSINDFISERLITVPTAQQLAAS